MKERIKVGIDLGTTFSACAFVNSETGTPEIITNIADGDSSLLPSAVLYQSESNCLVGTAALNEAEIYPDKIAQFLKRYMGVDPFPRPAGVPMTVNPVTFSSVILKTIKQYVDMKDYEIEEAVITVPAYFSLQQRNLTKEAAVLAKLTTAKEQVHIIDEPIAAALYYCDKRRPENKTFLVYDLGGGTFDVVVVKMEVGKNGQPEFNVLATDGNHVLGGKDWDDIMMEYILEEARKKIKNTDLQMIDITPKERQKLRDVATNTKIKLSKVESATARLSLYDKYTKKDEAIEVTINRQEFDRRTRSLLEKTINLVDFVLGDLNMQYADIDNVLLVGGSTYMTQVRDYIKEHFSEDKIIVNNPNFSVAYGAAIFANSISTENTAGTPQTAGIKINGISPRTFGLLIATHVEGYSEPVFYIDTLVNIRTPIPYEVESIYSAVGYAIDIPFYEHTFHTGEYDYSFEEYGEKKTGKWQLFKNDLNRYYAKNGDAVIFGLRTETPPYFEVAKVMDGEISGEKLKLSYLGKIRMEGCSPGEPIQFKFFVSVDGIRCVATMVNGQSQEVKFNSDSLAENSGIIPEITI